MIHRINMCRTYLRAETVADLCNAASTQISREAMDPLGKWVAEPTKKQWEAYIRPRDGAVAIRHPDGALYLANDEPRRDKVG